MKKVIFCILEVTKKRSSIWRRIRFWHYIGKLDPDPH